MGRCVAAVEPGPGLASDLASDLSDNRVLRSSEVEEGREFEEVEDGRVSVLSLSSSASSSDALRTGECDLDLVRPNPIGAAPTTFAHASLLARMLPRSTLLKLSAAMSAFSLLPLSIFSLACRSETPASPHTASSRFVRARVAALGSPLGSSRSVLARVDLLVHPLALVLDVAGRWLLPQFEEHMLVGLCWYHTRLIETKRHLLKRTCCCHLACCNSRS